MSTETLTPQTLTHAAPGSHEWLKARAGKIGGSSAANILCGGMPDVATRGTPLSEFLRLKQELEWLADGAKPADFPKGLDPVDEEADYIVWGNKSEELHRTMLMEKTGWPIRPFTSVVQDKEFSFLAGSPDALIGQGSTVNGAAVTRPWEGDGLAELKAPTYQTKPWREGTVPMAAQIQLSLYFRITGLRGGIVSGLVPPAPVYSILQHDQVTEEWMVEGLVRFWTEHIEKDIPPAPVASEKDVRAAKALFSKSEDRVVQFDDEMRAIAHEFETMKQEQKALEGEIDQRKAQILLAMGDARWGYVEDGFVYRNAWQGEEKEVTFIRKPSLVLRRMKGVK